MISQNLQIVFLMAAVVGLGCADATDELPAFRIMTKRQEDKVEVKVDKDTAIFSVHSPFGISQATIERTVEKWPDSVMLRLHLKGLESFEGNPHTMQVNWIDFYR